MLWYVHNLNRIIKLYAYSSKLISLYYFVSIIEVREMCNVRLA